MMLSRPSSNGRGPTGVSQERYEFTLIQQCFGYVFHNLLSWRFSFAVVDMGSAKGPKSLRGTTCLRKESLFFPLPVIMLAISKIKCSH
jgi:hypothetical protein